MVYANLKFPLIKSRPFFYTNFVVTVDGKVQVLNNPYAYWPIGSKVDHQTLIELRAHADVLVHGKNTAVWMRHIDNLEKEEFRVLRKKLGKKDDLAYVVLSNNPDKKLLKNLKGSYKAKFLATSKMAYIPGNFSNVLRLGEKRLNIKVLSKYLYDKGYKNVLVEGGPKVLSAFLSNGLLDEIFLTIAPKIFGSKKNSTLTMIEDFLFPSDKVKNLELLSVKKVEDEVYLRYKVLNH
ncbi:MAG: RibD family protein [Candidatus Levybacteria bacterium]|nr:RibD family protein [Candidatus Levybacteria bacterium]